MMKNRFTFLDRIVFSSIFALLISNYSFAGMIIDGPANARQNGKVVAILYDGIETSDFRQSSEKRYSISFFIKVTDKEMEDKKIIKKRILYDKNGHKIGEVVAPINLYHVYDEESGKDFKNIAEVWFTTYIDNRKIKYEKYFKDYKCKDVFDFKGWRERGLISYYGKCVKVKKDLDVYYQVKPILLKNKEIGNDPKYSYKTKVKKGSEVLLISSKYYTDNILEDEIVYIVIQFDNWSAFVFGGSISESPLGVKDNIFFFNKLFEPINE